MNQNINANFVNQVPGKNLNGYFAFSLNLKQVSKLLKDMNLLSELDNALAKQGFTSSEVFDAFSERPQRIEEDDFGADSQLINPASWCIV